MSSTRAQWSGGWQLTVGGRWQHVAVVDTGCRCRPRRPRLQSFLRPSHPSSSSGSTGTYSSYSSSNRANDSASADVYKDHQQPYGVTAKASAPVATKKVVSKQVKKGCEKLAAAAEEVEDEEEDVGVAVEKESSDPRADFHDSMVQMVVEMGLCDWDGLRSMLRRLLALNAPRHHAAILAAFAEVFAQLASESPAPPPPAYQYTSDE